VVERAIVLVGIAQLGEELYLSLNLCDVVVCGVELDDLESDNGPGRIMDAMQRSLAGRPGDSRTLDAPFIDLSVRALAYALLSRKLLVNRLAGRAGQGAHGEASASG
jgi:hypothetical protein